jgi:hypothetical protein
MLRILVAMRMALAREFTRGTSHFRGSTAG